MIGENGMAEDWLDSMCSFHGAIPSMYTYSKVCHMWKGVTCRPLPCRLVQSQIPIPKKMSCYLLFFQLPSYCDHLFSTIRWFVGWGRLSKIFSMILISWRCGSHCRFLKIQKYDIVICNGIWLKWNYFLLLMAHLSFSSKVKKELFPFLWLNEE